MTPKNYIVTKIEGEYAYIKDIDSGENDELFIALALLSPNIDVGTKLHYEMFEYTIID